MLRNGFEYYEVLPEPKACDICKPKAGKKYRVDKMITGETAPPSHPYCRCAIVEVFEGDRKLLDIEPRSDTIKVKNIQLPHSLSDMAKPIYVKREFPVRENLPIKQGSTITNVEVIAGKDVRRQIDDILRLVREHGGKAKDWQKVKGHATLSDGTRAEVHWYQAKNVGKVEFKVKRYL